MSIDPATYGSPIELQALGLDVAAAPAADGAADAGEEAASAGPGRIERAVFGDDGFTFGDLLDIVNPLQHVPVISTIYRSLSGDSIAPGPRLAGGGLFGGLFGLAGAAVNVAVEQTTGKDVGGHVVAMLGDGQLFDGLDSGAAPALDMAAVEPHELLAMLTADAPLAPVEAAPAVPLATAAAPVPPSVVDFANLEPHERVALLAPGAPLAPVEAAPVTTTTVASVAPGVASPVPPTALAVANLEPHERVALLAPGAPLAPVEAAAVTTTTLASVAPGAASGDEGGASPASLPAAQATATASSAAQAGIVSADIPTLSADQWQALIRALAAYGTVTEARAEPAALHYDSAR